MTDLRARAVAEALSWAGTPYCHGQSVKGVGSDCLGLTRGVWHALYGAEPMAIPAYSPDWAEIDAGEPLLSGLGRCLTPIALKAAQAGDVVAFRMRDGAAAKHLGVLTQGRFGERQARFVHAYWGRAVVMSWLHPFWVTKAVAAFSFLENGECVGR